MRLDLERVRADVRQAATEDLLDRATVYRDGMEPEALDVIEAELRQRGVRVADIEAHGEARARVVLWGPDGLPVPCRTCGRPAVVAGQGWARLWWLVPLFPRRVAYCERHRPAGWAAARGPTPP
jgi:hypothetical protein